MASGVCYAVGYELMDRIDCTVSVLAIAKEFKLTKYFLDPQTGLCFVTRFSDLANVPCNKYVKGKLLE